MNIYVYLHGKLIRYPDLPDNINAEEFVVDRYPLGEIQWGEYEEEEIIYDGADNLIKETLGKTRYQLDKEQEQQQVMFQNLHKEMEQDGF